MKISYYQFKQKQSGSTLLEILVSVFVLGFGLLALVSMQLKTVMTAREAENQTIIAQAADALIEGMVINPTRTVEVVGENQVIKRSFQEYIDLAEAKTITKDCVDDVKLSITGAAGTVAAGITKKDVARGQICAFVKRVNQIPNTGNVNWRICNEDPADAAQTPILNSGSITCGSGTHAVLKVIWEQELEDVDKYKNSDLHLNTQQTAVLYTYQAPISQ